MNYYRGNEPRSEDRAVNVHPPHLPNNALLTTAVPLNRHLLEHRDSTARSRSPSLDSIDVEGLSIDGNFDDVFNEEGEGSNANGEEEQFCRADESKEAQLSPPDDVIDGNFDDIFNEDGEGPGANGDEEQFRQADQTKEAQLPPPDAVVDSQVSTLWGNRLQEDLGIEKHHRHSTNNTMLPSTVLPIGQTEHRGSITQWPPPPTAPTAEGTSLDDGAVFAVLNSFFGEDGKEPDTIRAKARQDSVKSQPPGCNDGAISEDIFADEQEVPVLQGNQQRDQSRECGLVALRQWMTGGILKCEGKEHLMRKLAVAYGIAELLIHNADSRNGPSDVKNLCNLENFAVRVSLDSEGEREDWDDVVGVAMMNPAKTLSFVDHSIKSQHFVDKKGLGGSVLAESNDDADGSDGIGLTVKVEEISVNCDVPGEAADCGRDEVLCHSFGLMFYELFAGQRPSLIDTDTLHANEQEPVSNLEVVSSEHTFWSPQKDIKLKGTEEEREPKRYSSQGNLRHTRLLDLGLPSSLSALAENLLGCKCREESQPPSAYPSLKAVAEDLRLLLRCPNRFLFDRIVVDNNQLLRFRKDRLYGRDSQVSIIMDTICRVALTGENEALFVSGYSGSGKSKLIESVVDKTDSVGGYVIAQKFDQMQQERPLSAIISAMNLLPLLILQKNSPEEVSSIIEDFTSVFGIYLPMLIRVIPNIAILIPQPNGGAYYNNEAQYEPNFHNLSFIIQLFMRVVSSKCRLVLLFLDDLQWASSADLDLVRTLISDTQGCSHLFFVGSYRNNEVGPEHPIFGFINNLSSLNVRKNVMHLDGMAVEDLNLLVADALCVLPHISMPLSRIVHSKTKGNPFFTLEFLRSLVDRCLIQYSVWERRCVWDESKIREEDITDNVLHLLSHKMSSMPAIQALKIASCFGLCLSADLVKCLNNIPEHRDFEMNLNEAISEGFMERSGAGYKFVHDRVREAAFNLIPPEEKDKFQHQLGVMIYTNTPEEQFRGNMTFLVADRINSGGPSLICPTQLVSIIGLNCNAAKEAMSSSNFTAALFYLKTAANLLPPDHWQAHYDLSKRLFLLFGNAAFASGHMGAASESVNSLIDYGRSIEDKLDAYYILVLIQQAQQRSKEAYSTCIKVLTLLGEKIPSSVPLDEIFPSVYKIQSQLAKMSDDDILNMTVMESKSKLALMQFYCQVHFLGYFVKPDNGVMHFFTDRLIELCIEHGISKFSARAFSQFGMMLGGNTIKDTENSYRMGKIALQFILKFNASDQLPKVYLQYYSYIAVHREPFQSCAEMLRQGHKIGLTVGDFQTAFLDGIHYIQKALIAGANLLALKEHCEYQAKLIDSHSQSFSKAYLKLFQGTIDKLMYTEGNVEEEEEKEVGNNDFAQAILFHGVMRCFWKGHAERCHFYAEKYSSSFKEINQVKSVIILFYHGIISFRSRHKNTNKKQITKIALETVRRAAKESEWNYSNKVHLLEAELYSSNSQKHAANIAYDQAIKASHRSKFVHEQGLSCELAGHHYKMHRDFETARKYFDQAKECYKKWGSHTKVAYITDQINLIKGK